MSKLKLNLKRAPVMSMFIEIHLFGSGIQKLRSAVQFHDELWLNLSYIQLNIEFWDLRKIKVVPEQVFFIVSYA